MKILGIIPARYQSTRFPGKPLIDIHGKTMIQRVYEQCLKSKSLHNVVVATDDLRIEAHCKEKNIHCILTLPSHINGTERCAEVAEKMGSDYDLIINIQGDEPFIEPQAIDEIASIFEAHPNREIGTLVKKMNDLDLKNQSSIIKCVIAGDKALYFSRSPIPFFREISENSGHFYKHIGMYAFRPYVLKEIVKLSPSSLELAESLEQLRWLENHYEIYVYKTETDAISVDTPEDLNKILKLYPQ
jgi:3-deoxy-manno-octulosonate cytidylyltransferase (CMP-KDO synthetase)